ncbi:vitamin B12 receptor precursor [Flavilitoribacter nigricans DSM 23189 = NBRC 102662]|uniref:Vitamin B12 receptor n=2 Tax=Flavilitoribacter TaxID=2762562 RepID=A0A2D0MYP8_FLAN2|nr:vitamin B12 receptor precursor [Flavilitoribacter nigricans DSM 23189 = NBRC 102662]
MNGMKLWLLSGCLLLAGMLTAQNATIQGTVTDQKTGEALFFANVSVGATGVVTELDGTYQLAIPPGNYTLQVTYVGYTTYSEELRIEANETIERAIALEPESTILNTATVTSGKYETPLSEVTVSLEVIQPELIESTSKPTLDEALQKVPGVTIIDGQANIRGGSGYSQGAGSRVLLLVDDVPILQADAGFPNWDDVPIENIEQIEVVKGAASALYGSSALNGIINVRTAYAKAEPETKLATFYTTYFAPKDKNKQWWDEAPNTFATSLAHRRKMGKLDLVLGGYYINQESFRKDTYKKFGRFNFNTRYRATDRLTFGLASNINQGSSGSYFYWKSAEEAFEGAPTTLSERERLRFNVDPTITYFDRSGNRHKILGRYYYVDNNNDRNQSNSSQWYYGEYQFQRRFADIGLVTTAGLVVSGNQIDAELYGDTTFTASNLAAFVQLEKKFLDRLNVSAGFRYERNVLNNPGFTYQQGTVDPSEEKESKPVFRLGLNYELADYTFLRASWGQGYRFPTVAEKFIFTDAGGFFITPNPTLRSETGWSTEIGIKQGFRLSSFEGFIDISGFLMRYEDMMEFNLVGFGFQASNIGGTEIKGMEFTVAGRGSLFGLPTSILAGYTYIDPRFKEFDNTQIPAGETGSRGQVNANNSSSEDNILKYRSRHTFKLDLESRFRRFSLGWETISGSQIEAIDRIFNLIVPGLESFRMNNQGYLVHNVRAAYRFTEDIKLSMILGNLTNREYSIRPGLLEGPRNLTARLDFKF